jgi:hypothetical protein
LSETASTLARRIRFGVERALERPAAIAWKDLLVFGKHATAWKGAVAALLFLGPLVAFAAAAAEYPGPWRSGLHALGLGIAALFSTFSFAVTVPAATSVALERDRETLAALVVSPASGGELVLGKLLAALANALVAKALLFPALAIVYALGGLEAGFIPRFFLVLLAADVSLGSLALHLSSRPLRPPRVGAASLKLGVSQAQLALQRSLGISVVGSLLPIYASIFGLVFVLQQGLPLGRWLESLGALGVLHPLLAVVAWGPVYVYGRAVPLWLLATLFHALLALPLIASAAEAQRGHALERGRLPRAGFVVWFVFAIALAGGAAASGTDEVRALVPAGLGGAIAVAAVLVASSSPPGARPFGRREVLLSLLDPRRAFASAPETACGLALALALVLAPFVFAASSPGAAARATSGLALAALGIAALGARLAARSQAKEAAAFARALAGPRGNDRDAREDAAVEEPSTGAPAVFGLGFVFLALAPVLAGLGLALSKSALPGLAPFAPAFRALAGVAGAANPLVALVPLVDSKSALGQLLAGAPELVGVEPGTLAWLGLAFWGIVLVGSLASLKRAPEAKVV